MTLHNILTKYLQMKPTKTDPLLYFSFRHGKLEGINGYYVDELLRTGTLGFKKYCEKTDERFETSGDESLPLTFAGFTLSKRRNSFYVMDQNFYLKKLECIKPTCNFNEFRSMRMNLAWLANTRPDLLFEISQLVQVNTERFSVDAAAQVKRLNAAIRYAHNNVAHLPLPKLNLRSIGIVGYSDAAFANNYDMTSQLCRIVLLMDDENCCIPISFKSYKSCRVTRSVLSIC